MPDPFVPSLIQEIARALDRLAQTGAETVLDLRALPLSPDDRARLDRHLGRGEVTITFDALGRSKLWETAYPGLWWVRHRGADDRILTERLEIAAVPEALAAGPADFTASALRLGEAPLRILSQEVV